MIDRKNREITLALDLTSSLRSNRTKLPETPTVQIQVPTPLQAHTKRENHVTTVVGSKKLVLKVEQPSLRSWNGG
jgi:hypothetical protein